MGDGDAEDKTTDRERGPGEETRNVRTHGEKGRGGWWEGKERAARREGGSRDRSQEGERKRGGPAGREGRPKEDSGGGARGGQLATLLAGVWSSLGVSLALRREVLRAGVLSLAQGGGGPLAAWHFVSR